MILTFASYSSSDINRDGNSGIFDRYLDVYGLRLYAFKAYGGLPAVEDEFIRKTAQTLKLLLDPRAAGIDLSLQGKAIKSLSDEKAVQRIAVGSLSLYDPPIAGSDTPVFGWDLINDTYRSNDMTYQLIDDSRQQFSPIQRNQITQQLEHLLHTLTHFALPGAFPNEINPRKGTGLLWDAAQEAIDKGVYDPADYEGISRGSDGEISNVYRSVVMTEYLYALTYAMWGYTGKYTEDLSLDPEWSDDFISRESIKNANPLGYDLFVNYISKVISKPYPVSLESIYQDNNGGEANYFPGSFFKEVSASTWSSVLEMQAVINSNGKAGATYQSPQVRQKWSGGPAGTILNGSEVNETLRGLAGWDIIDAGDGDDLVHGGNGRDIITGGSGSDELHGDFGWNTYNDQRDDSIDLIAIKSDHYLSNWLYGKAGNSPNGEKSDIIKGLNSYDQIKIIGVATKDLSFKNSVSHKGVIGVGIYANGILEALYTGGDLNANQIKSMTTGDASAQAMANQMWSYWGDNTPPALLA